MRKITILGLVVISTTLTGCKNGELSDTKNYDSLDDFVGEYVAYSAYNDTEDILYNGDIFLKVEKHADNDYSFILPKIIVVDNKPYESKIKSICTKDDIETIKLQAQTFGGIEAYKESSVRHY